MTIQMNIGNHLTAQKQAMIGTSKTGELKAIQKEVNTSKGQFCQNCGTKKEKAEAKFCNYCGAEFD